MWREQIDYQAHKLARHGKNFSKTQAKEARKIELDYRYNFIAVLKVLGLFKLIQNATFAMFRNLAI